MAISKKMRWGGAAVVVFCLVAGFGAGRAAFSQSARDQDEYRVELVTTDQYKIAKALNQMSSQGWVYVSSIQRYDGKALLVFQRAR
jgi:hypothetical protein